VEWAVDTIKEKQEDIMEEICNVIPLPIPENAKKFWNRVLLVAIPTAIGFMAGLAISQISDTSDDYVDDDEIEE